MRRFLINIVLFIAIPLVLYVPIYIAYYYKTLPKNNNACYVWGDSQMFQDVDLSYLDSNSMYRFYSAAAHGAGIYDFLVFAESVPANSRVVIQISRPGLLRRKEKDRNVSAINVNSMIALFQNGYSLNELSLIVKNNLVPHKMFYTENYLYPSANTVSTKEPISLFTSIYTKKPTYLTDKEQLYLKGIKTLLDKKCKVVALIFPYHPTLDSIESKSGYKPELDRFDQAIAANFPNQAAIEIKVKENIFTDLTHLNERGAKYLTKELAPMLDFKNTPMLIRVKRGN